MLHDRHTGGCRMGLRARLLSTWTDSEAHAYSCIRNARGAAKMRNAQRLRVFLRVLRSGAVVVNGCQQRLCARSLDHVAGFLRSCGCCATCFSQSAFAGAGSAPAAGDVWSSSPALSSSAPPTFITKSFARECQKWHIWHTFVVKTHRFFTDWHSAASARTSRFPRRNRIGGTIWHVLARFHVFDLRLSQDWERCLLRIRYDER